MGKQFTAVSNRPSDEQIPDWANYIAMDSDGCWWAYSTKPVLDSEGGGFGDRSADEQRSCVEIGDDSIFEDYADSLEKIKR